MLITYIHHSCFSLETEKSVFLFDYYKGNIPNFPKEKHLFVLSSHSHQDHFNHDIFKLLNDYPQITYILSKDINIRKSFFSDPDAFENAKNHIITIGKNESLPLSSSLTLETFRSTDKGVAFLIEEGGHTFYHAGDLNWWIWTEDTKADSQNMTRAFKDEIQKLRGRNIDIAFLVLDPRQEEFYSLGFDFFMRNTNTSYAFPMHFWKDYSIIDKFKASDEALPYQNKIVEITEEGQTFCIPESERTLL
jgi:L-ascorbate metabolism protein UlaG (beta-lactamase superfamily)